MAQAHRGWVTGLWALASVVASHAVAAQPTAGAGAAGDAAAAPADVEEEPDAFAELVSHVRFFGSVRVDAVWDDSRLQDAELPMWVVNEHPTTGNLRDDAELTIHPWLTRVGIALDETALADGLTASAKVELDFLQEREDLQPRPRFMHAYARISYHEWSLLIGHTDDLMSPLYPSVNAASRMWNAGNLGDRRAQFRIGFESQIGKGQLRIAAAAGMPNAVDEQDLDGDGDLDGYDAAVPMGQGLIELSGAYWTRKRLFRVGLSGHLAIEEVGDVDDDNPPPGAFDYDGERRLHAFSLVGHLQVPILENMWLSGEGFYGQNLSDVRGGVGESISFTTGQEVRAFGGWGQLSLKPARWFTGHIGGSIDHPVDGDVADGQRSRNVTFFAGSHFHPIQDLTLAVELSYWVTSYQNRGDGKAQRYNFWSSYSF